MTKEELLKSIDNLIERKTKIEEQISQLEQELRIMNESESGDLLREIYFKAIELKDKNIQYKGYYYVNAVDIINIIKKNEAMYEKF